MSCNYPPRPGPLVCVWSSFLPPRRPRPAPSLAPCCLLPKSVVWEENRVHADLGRTDRWERGCWEDRAGGKAAQGRRVCEQTRALAARRAGEPREGSRSCSLRSRRRTAALPVYTPRRLCFEDTRVFRSSSGVERSQTLHCSPVTACPAPARSLGRHRFAGGFQPVPLGLAARTCPVQRRCPRRPPRQGCVPAACEVC